MNIKRGGIYIVFLDPVIGKEISKTRQKESVPDGQQLLIIPPSPPPW